MYFIRRLTALLLMVTLPAYAGAALGLSELCPMRSAPMSEAADGGHPCCDPAGMPADAEHGMPDTSPPCKPGQECKSASLFHPLVPPATQPFMATATVVAGPESAVPAGDASRLWRPPRAL